MSDSKHSTRIYQAETLIYGGPILNPTLGGLEPIQALLVQGGKITAAGKLSDVENLTTPSTRRLHLEGRTLLPGFNDAHVHIWKVGQLRTTLLDLRGAKSLAEVYARVEERAKTLKPGEWLWGRGWNEALLAEKAMPAKAVLDRVSPRNPVLLTRTCAHIHAVNSQAMQLSTVQVGS